MPRAGATGKPCEIPGADAAYEDLLRSARRDPNILGIVLSGSRGAGWGRPHSDYDLHIIVPDAAETRYRAKFLKTPPGIDLRVIPISAFRRFATFDSPSAGYGPAFAHIQVPVDRTGRIGKIAREKARIPPRHVRLYTSENLDGYINRVLRSLKNFQDGIPMGGHLEATQSIPYLLETLFAAEGRRAPYAKFLEWDLRTFPLHHPPLPLAPLLRRIARILVDGDPETQRELFRAVERSLRPRGYGRIFDGWSADQLTLMRRGRRRA